MSRHGGFTLIELMIVVAIIGILAAVAIPKFADLVRKSQEGATKGQLGTIRSALGIYYADNEALYPQGPKTNPSTILEDSLVPTYLNKMPRAKLPPYHSPSNLVRTHETPYTHDHDSGYWGYGSLMADPGWGDLWLMCDHTDAKGAYWSTY